MTKLRVLILVEYETKPEDYPDQDPKEMFKLDIEQDPAATILESDWKIISAVLIDD